MDINLRVKLESPELMAALLALAEALPQIKLGDILPISEGEILRAKSMNHNSENINEALTKEELKSIELGQREIQNIGVKTITLEAVREKLSLLSQRGKQAQVKALIQKFGGNKLTEVHEMHYEAILKEAEGL